MNTSLASRFTRTNGFLLKRRFDYRVSYLSRKSGGGTLCSVFDMSQRAEYMNSYYLSLLLV